MPLLSSIPHAPNSSPALPAIRFPIAGLALLALTAIFGCNDPDPAAELRYHFDILQQETEKVHELLDQINDKESAEAIAPKLKSHIEAMEKASMEVGLRRDVKSRSAIALLNRIDDFDEKWKLKNLDQKRRLEKIPEADKVLKEFLADPEDSKPQMVTPEFNPDQMQDL